MEKLSRVVSTLFLLAALFQNVISESINWSMTNCSYPVTSSGGRAGVIFEESETLVDFQLTNGELVAFYLDEHPLTLGVEAITVVTSSGSSSTQTFDFTTFTGNQPYCVQAPLIGATAFSGDYAPLDVATCTSQSNCGRPIPPALFITDITTNPGLTSGDWQNGGFPLYPTKVCGVWKGATRTVNHQTSVISVVPDADPTNLAPTGWNVGSSLYNTTKVVPQSNEWGAIAAWSLQDLNLIPYHSYRFEVMVHDGDQVHTGGDAGLACINFFISADALTASQTTGDSSSGSSSNQTGVIVGWVLGIMAGLSLIIAGSIAGWKNRKKIKAKGQDVLKKWKIPMLGSTVDNPLYAGNNSVHTNPIREKLESILSHHNANANPA